MTLYTHPRILSPGATGADAILADHGTIIAMGPRNALREMASGVSEIALPGAAVVAGFHDAHIHAGSVARDLASVDLRAARSLDAALDTLRSHLLNRPGSEWVTGGYWDANHWPSGLPNRHELDEVCADRPIALASVDGHSVWVNSLGLRLAGIDAASPDPVGGLILRGADGREPTGILRESACDAVRELSERDLDPSLPELLEQAQERLLAMGLTHITDFDEDVTRLSFERLRAEGRLKLRVHKGIPQVDLDRAIAEGWRTGRGDRWITTGPVKLFSDGALGSHSAHMLSDFADDPGNQGVEVLPVEELVALVTRANSAGIAVATHAIGDRANRNVLDAYAAAVAITRRAGLRNRVEHAQHIGRGDVARFAALGVIASLQPTHCTTDFRLAGRRIGERDLANYAWRSLLDAGAHVAFGSDAPIEPANPMYGVHAAVTRQNRDGEPDRGFEPHERVGVGEALSLFSAGSAYAAGLESVTGRIAEGQYADFVALDADPTTTDPADLATISVAATIVDGEIVYTSAS
jgi:predicted amidohydrolase YtcJ